MKRLIKGIAKISFLCLCFILLISPIAMADQYGFEFISNNSGIASSLDDQLYVLVTDAGGGQVRFEFHNAGPISSSICDIYFDDGTLLGIASIADSGSGVAFSQGANPGDLPGGNTLSPSFETTAGFLADSDSPVAPNGVNPGEWVAIIFNLQSGGTFQNVLDELESGELRIGLHVQSIGTNGQSDSFVNDGTTQVPEPATMLLLGSGLVGLWGLRRKFRK